MTKIAIVADWMTSRGGAERVLEAFIKVFPKADVLTSVYNPDLFPELKGRTVKTSYLQSLPAKIRNKHPFLLPFFPSAFYCLDTKEYDVVISSSSAFSKCIKDRDGQIHICYCHTPTRYLYHAKKEYVHQYPLPFFLKPLKYFLYPLFSCLEISDKRAARNVDKFFSNSNYIGDRIKKYYKKDSETLYPCTNTSIFTAAALKAEKQDYYLAVGRFIPYKKFDLIVETFKQNGLPLKLAGKGPELKRCKELAKGCDNIEFLGFVGDDDLPMLYAQAKGFLFPAEEDFGLTPIEAMAAGTPVIYYNKGGATESVNKWGIAFDEQTPSSLQKGINRLEVGELSVSKEDLIQRAKEFDTMVFQKKIKKIVEQYV